MYIWHVYICMYHHSKRNHYTRYDVRPVLDILFSVSEVMQMASGHWNCLNSCVKTTYMKKTAKHSPEMNHLDKVSTPKDVWCRILTVLWLHTYVYIYIYTYIYLYFWIVCWIMSIPCGQPDIGHVRTVRIPWRSGGCYTSPQSLRTLFAVNGWGNSFLAALEAEIWIAA